MGIFDSLGSLFSSTGGVNATGYTGQVTPIVSLLGSLLGSIKATPRAGATRKDMEKAERINMLTGLLGTGLSAYGERENRRAQQTALQGLFDIYKNQGMTQNMQGPTMPGEMPLDAGLSQRIFAWGQQNPGLSEQAMKLGLDAMNQDVANQRYAQEMDLKRSEIERQASQWEKTFNAQRDYQNASLGLDRQKINLQRQEIEANKPFKMLQTIGGIFGDDVAREIAPQILGGQGVTKPIPTTSENQYMTPIDGGQAQQILDPIQNARKNVAQRELKDLSLKRVDELRKTPDVVKSIDDATGLQTILQQFGSIVENVKKSGGYMPMDKTAFAKLFQQTIEKGLAVNPSEVEAAISPEGGFSSSTAGNFLRRLTGGTGLNDINIERAFTNMTELVRQKNQEAKNKILGLQKFGARTGVLKEDLDLLGFGLGELNLDDYSNKIRSNFSQNQGNQPSIMGLTPMVTPVPQNSYITDRSGR